MTPGVSLCTSFFMSPIKKNFLFPVIIAYVNSNNFLSLQMFWHVMHFSLSLLKVARNNLTDIILFAKVNMAGFLFPYKVH